jgi:Family of unknown function (DUF5678)
MGAWNQTSPGAQWAMWDIPTAEKYGGKWVVAIPNEVIEAGDDPDAVREAAARKLGLPPDDLAICVVAPLESRVWFGWW